MACGRGWVVATPMPRGYFVQFALFQMLNVTSDNSHSSTEPERITYKVEAL
jgi:hypothetical protein